MNVPSPLLTCRYWALGSGCPNRSGGRNTCPFAHWDTGTLASDLIQRGTCKYWLNGRCGGGKNCWYEHRHTGVPGLNQGPITLYGMDLEIANAAAKAGFNTWNQSGLLDLIWAVKRIALRSVDKKGAAHPPPPKDPIYPERYRPSGVGDNTKRKRITAPSYGPEPTTVKLEAFFEPRRRFRRPRQRNRGKNKQFANVNASSVIIGTRDIPIDLLSDDEDGSAPTSAKRQKLNVGRANVSQPRKAPETRSTVSGLGYGHGLNRDVSRDFNISRAPPAQTLMEDLRQVRSSLQASAKEMGLCMTDMSSCFEKYPERLAQDVMMPLLRKLRESIETAERCALTGADDVDEVMRLAG